MRSNMRARTAFLVTCMLICGSVVFASGTQQAAATDGPFEMSIMIEANVTNDPARVVPIIEEYTNTRLDIQYIQSMREVLPVSIAAGDLPDVVGSWWSRQPYHVSAIRGGVFRDLTDFIADYQYLSQIPQQVYTNTSIDGRVYGLPRMRAFARPSFSYRADWLENLGMSVPTTIDEFYEMLRAFTFDDPNRSGQKDTFGLTDRAGNATMSVTRMYGIMFGAPNGWGVRPDGSFYAAIETPEFLEALKFARRIVSEGLIPQDWVVVADQPMKDRFISGQAGVYPRHIDESYLMQNFMPDATIGTMSQLAGPKGVRTTGESGAGGIVLFTSAAFRDDASLRRGLKFFDDLGSPEMSNLFQWGIEGTHYRVEDGKAAMIDPSGYARELEHLRNQLLALHASINSIPGKLDPLREFGEALKVDNQQYAIFDPTLPLISETASEIGAQLNTQITDAMVRYISGELNDAGWTAAVEAWRRAGGSRLATEYAELHRQAQR